MTVSCDKTRRGVGIVPAPFSFGWSHDMDHKITQDVAWVRAIDCAKCCRELVAVGDSLARDGKHDAALAAYAEAKLARAYGDAWQRVARDL